MQIFQQSEHNKSTKSLSKVDNIALVVISNVSLKSLKLHGEAQHSLELFFITIAPVINFSLLWKTTKVNQQTPETQDVSDVRKRRSTQPNSTSFKWLHLNTDSEVRGMLWTEEGKDMESHVSDRSCSDRSCSTSQGFNSDRSCTHSSWQRSCWRCWL